MCSLRRLPTSTSPTSNSPLQGPRTRPSTKNAATPWLAFLELLMTRKSNSPRNHRPRLTYTETLTYYNQSGRSFEVPCPAHDNLHLPLRISRGPWDSLRVDCDNGCTREAILEALTALIRGGSVPPAESLAPKPEPRDQPSHMKANS